MLTRKLPNAAGTLITVTTVATSLQSLIETAASEAFSLAGLDAIDLRPDGDIRFLADGNTPTSTEGLLLDTFTSLRGIDLSKMQLISPLGSVTVEIQVGKALQGETDFVEGASGGGGGTPGSPAGSIQGNNAGSFAGVPDSSIDFTTGVVGYNAALLYKSWEGHMEVDEFDTNSVVGWSTSISAGNTVNAQQAGPSNDTSLHPGAVRFQSAGTGHAALSRTTVTPPTVLFGNGTHTLSFMIYLTALSNATDEYDFYVGFNDTLTGTGNNADGVYFKYKRTESVNWQLCTASNSVRTETISSQAVEAGKWILCQVVVNAAGTSAEYFIGRAGNGTLTSLGTVTTNIPTAAGRWSAPSVKVDRLAGVTSIVTWLDYYSYGVEYSAARF